jgi:hypothetical protein
MRSSAGTHDMSAPNRVVLPDPVEPVTKNVSPDEIADDKKAR